MDYNQFFGEVMGFIAKVHEKTHEYLIEARPEGLTPLQCEILEYIYFEQNKTISDIAHCLKLSLPNCSREIKKLEQGGYIKKVQDTEDRRKSYISLDENGLKFTEVTFERLKVRIFNKLGDISEEELKANLEAIRLLEKHVFK